MPMGLKMNSLRLKGLLLLAVVLCGSAGAATRHALLIGVGSYDDPVSALLAPRFDVTAVENTLLEKWAFEPTNVTRLLDGDATREGILRALRNLQLTTEPGDFVFVYYAGHGTSALDLSVAAALPHTSGALIPADFNRHGTPEEIAESLIIGRRDIRPILAQLDAAGREVFFVVDACYSGNTVRGAGQEHTGRPPLPVRAADILPPDVQATPAPPSEEAYPYSQVFYLSAAGEHEPAGEITDKLLRWYPTFDGQPHGAFTDALLRAMQGLTPGTDANGDGRVSYLELYESVRGFMEKRGYPQSPQFLPTIDEAQVDPSTAIIFDLPGEPQFVQPAPEPDQPLRLKWINPSEADRRLVKSLSGLEITDGDADLILLRESDRSVLLNASGDLISEVFDPASADPWHRIRGELFVRGLASRGVAKGANQNLVLQYTDPAMGVTAVRGDDLGFVMRPSLPLHLLVFDLESNGGISLLYPINRQEKARQPAGRLTKIEDIVVVPPFGMDKIVAVGLGRPLEAAGQASTEGLGSFLGQTLDPGSDALARFQQLLAGRDDLRAVAQLSLITTDSVNRAARGGADRGDKE